MNGGQASYAPPPPPQRAPTAAKNDAKAKRASTTSRVQSGPNWGSTGGQLVPVQDTSRPVIFPGEACPAEDGQCTTMLAILPSFGDLARVAVAAWEAVFGGAAAPAARGIGIEAATLRGTLIGQGLRGATGKMASISAQVTGLGLPQAEAAAATNAAVQALGLRTAVVQVGSNTVVSSVLPGVARPVLVVGQSGSVVQMAADIAVESGAFVVRNLAPW